MSDPFEFPLSDGEHVLTAADVAAMGGQDAVYRFREDLRRPEDPDVGRD